MQTELERTRTRLASLIEINQSLMSTVETDDLLRAIIKSAIQLFSVEACSIGLIDETTQQVAFAFSSGGAQVEEFRIAVGQGIAGWVAQTGQEVLSNDVSRDPRFFQGIDQQTGFRTKSVLCAPLKQHDHIIGVIEAMNTTLPTGFTPEDLQLLMAFGSLAATALSRAKAFVSVRNTNVAFQETIQDRYQLVVGASVAMQDTLRMARTAAATTSTVLLLGESGTGKEVVARAIHQWSPRAEQPFVAVNCTALTPDLFESELFGHDRGAFTGAIAQKKGKFELADGGTIFLDEIGDLPPNLQVKLLRVLQDKEFQHVGGVKNIRVDVRILAATNRNLPQAMQQGTFREDLYYRLNVVSLTLPPLRERRDDVPMLVRHFVEHYCHEMTRPVMFLGPEALSRLQAYTWPGNVRELQNVIERAVALSPGPAITVADLPIEVRREAVTQAVTSTLVTGVDDDLPLAEALDAFTRAKVRRTLEVAGGNQTVAAQLLGMPQSNLSRLMKRLRLR
ncbi:MAG: sigma-54-dependent Fis family transcriptional regulator [Deltaproteobacteria bacterium]|nr:sigma-54-dependent Fis family transcriptional regulator [Deltaproteobacteria bacterium]